MEQDQTQERGFKEKSVEFLKKNGFFVVLGLCAICVMVAVLLTLGPNDAAAPEQAPEAEEARLSQDEQLTLFQPTPTPEADADVMSGLVIQTPEATATPAPASKPASAPKAKSKYPAPVTGSVIFGFASDTLLYSKTLEQWATHEGVDIAAKEGAQVKAIRAGIVEKVYRDDALGEVVVIEHEDGFESVYGNLQENPPVKEGQKVESGDTVGLVGRTAISECELEPHVHFALYKNESPVDPSEYILLEK